MISWYVEKFYTESASLYKQMKKNSAQLTKFIEAASDDPEGIEIAQFVAHDKIGVQITKDMKDVKAKIVIMQGIIKKANQSDDGFS